MKAMSIIGIVFFSISLLFIIISLGDDDFESGVFFGIISLLYAIPYSIVGLVSSVDKTVGDASSVEKPYSIKNITGELRELSELKEKGILTDEEFRTLKEKFLCV